MTDLTAQERETINAAMSIIVAHTPENASWQFGANSKGPSSSAYFSAERKQYSIWEYVDFASAIQQGINFQAAEDETADERKARRVEHLKRQLAELESQA